jgi:hypothetical protein
VGEVLGNPEMTDESCISFLYNLKNDPNHIRALSDVISEFETIQSVYARTTRARRDLRESISRGLWRFEEMETAGLISVDGTTVRADAIEGLSAGEARVVEMLDKGDINGIKTFWEDCSAVTRAVEGEESVRRVHNLLQLLASENVQKCRMIPLLLISSTRFHLPQRQRQKTEYRV